MASLRPIHDAVSGKFVDPLMEKYLVMHTPISLWKSIKKMKDRIDILIGILIIEFG